MSAQQSRRTTPKKATPPPAPPQEQEQQTQPEEFSIPVSQLDPEMTPEMLEWECQSLRNQLADSNAKLAKAERLIMAYRNREFLRQKEATEAKPNREQRRAAAKAPLKSV